MPSWAMIDETAVPINGAVPVEVQLAAETAQREWVEESLRDLELLYREDFGWQKIGIEAEYQFTHEGRKKIAELARIMAIANPLIKRGVTLRCGYVWGEGVQVSIKDDGADGTQDINDTFQKFWDDPANRSVLTAPEAQVELERQAATDGDVFLALPTNPVTGRVIVRNIPFEEIDKIVSDPEDAETVWYYRRKWNALIEQADGTTKLDARTTYYPRLGYRPTLRPLRVRDPGEPNSTAEIRWDSPIKHVAVNKFRPGSRQRGIGDVFAALPWARLDKEFLENWAIYMKAMTRILWQYTTQASKVQKVASKIAVVPGAPGNPDGAGSSVVTDPNTAISAVSKSGAQIDAESHKPLASYVASALGVPVTILLSDPGSTGARAVAETLDEPMRREMGMRRSLWGGAITDIAGYVIDQAVIAPAGPLRGAVTNDDDRLIVTLPEGDMRDVEIVWPEWDSTPLETLMRAISLADSTDKVPPLVTIRFILQALGVEDIDEELAKITDDEGNYIPQTVRDQSQLEQAGDRGEI